MKRMQVFDCQHDMPSHIRRVFFNVTEAPGNDCYIDWNLEDFKKLSKEDFLTEYSEARYQICEWLVANGATDDEVLINHWW